MVYIFRHEIVGVVIEIGSNVKHFKVGDHVGVGTYVNSCRDCENCNEYQEIHCSKITATYNSLDLDGTFTKGGFSNYIIVHDRQVSLHEPRVLIFLFLTKL